MIYGAPLCLRASRFVFVALLMLGASSLFADGPDTEATNWLEKSKTALKAGSDEATTFAARALKASPTSADANRQMAFTLFWAGHFEDAARYMRRALASDHAALLHQGPLSEIMPNADARLRLAEVAPKAVDDTDLCFLTGAVLMVDDDRRRALAFLVRAEELAGTDSQAATLANNKIDDRSRTRAELALKTSDWDDAVRAFTYAALDAPTVAENYAGLVIALAGEGDEKTALQLVGNVYARYRYATLLPWLRGLTIEPTELVEFAKRLESSDNRGLAQYKLACLIYFSCGYYKSVSDAAVQALMIDKLDDFVHDLVAYMERNKLTGNPVSTSQPEPPPEQPGTNTEPLGSEPSKDKPATDSTTESAGQLADGTLEDARLAIRKGAYTDALKVLDGFTREDAEPVVYQLLFVVFVGRGELAEASTAFQTWFLKAKAAERKRLNALREMFATQDMFDAWRKQILVVRDADPNVGLPRLLNTYVEITRGRYASAREELVVARIESPANQTVQALDRMLESDEFIQDVTPEGLPDDPSPKALLAKGDKSFRTGDYEGAKSFYLRAMEADPTLPFLNMGLVRCYFALGEYEDAVRQLQVLFAEQEMATREARDFQLALAAGYDDEEIFGKHLQALKDECEARPLSSKPWLLYGMALLNRSDFAGARDALKVWYENDTSKVRDPIALKFYEYARKRAS